MFDSPEALRSIRFWLVLTAAIFGLLALGAEYRARFLERPRQLSATLRTHITELLKDHPAVIEFIYPIGNLEAERFTRQLADCFQIAGWTVRSAGPTSFVGTMGTPIGFMLSVNDADPAANAAAEAALRATDGGPVKVYRDPTRPTLWVAVGLRR